jgi:hypothetical protein
MCDTASPEPRSRTELLAERLLEDRAKHAGAGPRQLERLFQPSALCK